MSILRSIDGLGPGRRAAIYAKGALRCLPSTVQASLLVCASFAAAWSARGLAGWGGIELPALEMAGICAWGCLLPGLLRMAFFAQTQGAPLRVSPAAERFALRAAFLGAALALAQLWACPPLQAADDAIERAVMDKERFLAAKAIMDPRPAMGNHEFETDPNAGAADRDIFLREQAGAMDVRLADLRRWRARPTSSPAPFAFFIQQCFGISLVGALLLSGALSLGAMAWRSRGLALRAAGRGSRAASSAIRHGSRLLAWHAARAPSHAWRAARMAAGGMGRRAPLAKQGAGSAARALRAGLASAPKLPGAAKALARRSSRAARAKAAALGQRASLAWGRAALRAHESIVARGLGAPEEVSRFEQGEIEQSCEDPLLSRGEEQPDRLPRL